MLLTSRATGCGVGGFIIGELKFIWYQQKYKDLSFVELKETKYAVFA